MLLGVYSQVQFHAEKKLVEEFQVLFVVDVRRVENEAGDDLVLWNREIDPVPRTRQDQYQVGDLLVEGLVRAQDSVWVSQKFPVQVLVHEVDVIVFYPKLQILEPCEDAHQIHVTR